MIFNEDNKDARLAEKGATESINQRPLIQQLGITHVLVSPMRRAVQTALLSASSPHNDQNNTAITIVFVPILREQVTYKNTVASSVSEIKAFVASVMQEFYIDESCFIFDYSLL